MCLLDTTDGALMMTLYTSTALARDQIAVLYYSIVLTVVTIVVAIVIGVIQLLTLILNVAEPEGRFWDGVAVAGDYYDVFGVAICASFILFGGMSILLYTPWRRYIDRRRQTNNESQGAESAESDALLGEAESRDETVAGLEEDTSLYRQDGGVVYKLYWQNIKGRSCCRYAERFSMHLQTSSTYPCIEAIHLLHVFRQNMSLVLERKVINAQDPYRGDLGNTKQTLRGLDIFT
jgi:hypothetical protein